MPGDPQQHTCEVVELSSRYFPGRAKKQIPGFIVGLEQNIYNFSCQQGPFATFKLQYDRTCEWTGLKFSNDGKLILLSTNGGALRILDAFKGAVLHSFGVSKRKFIVTQVCKHLLPENKMFTQSSHK